MPVPPRPSSSTTTPVIRSRAHRLAVKPGPVGWWFANISQRSSTPHPGKTQATNQAGPATLLEAGCLLSQHAQLIRSATVPAAPASTGRETLQWFGACDWWLLLRPRTGAPFCLRLRRPGLYRGMRRVRRLPVGDTAGCQAALRGNSSSRSRNVRQIIPLKRAARIRMMAGEIRTVQPAHARQRDHLYEIAIRENGMPLSLPSY
jgi:hypothetical protein